MAYWHQGLAVLELLIRHSIIFAGIARISARGSSANANAIFQSWKLPVLLYKHRDGSGFIREWNVSPIPKPRLRSAARGLLDRDTTTYVYGSLKLLAVLVEWLQY